MIRTYFYYIYKLFANLPVILKMNQLEKAAFIDQAINILFSHTGLAL